MHAKSILPIQNRASEVFINNISIAKIGDWMTKTRYSVTLGESLSRGIADLVDRGIFLDPQDLIRESIRNTLERYGAGPFKREAEG